MLEPSHLLFIIGLDQVKAHESAQDAPAGIGLHLCDCSGVEPAGRVKNHALCMPGVLRRVVIMATRHRPEPAIDPQQ